MDTYARRNGAGSPYNLGNRYGGSTSPKDWTKPPSSLPEAFENRNIRKKVFQYNKNKKIFKD